MTGPLGDTAGKGGRPELDAVKPLTVAEAAQLLSELSDGRGYSLSLHCVGGRYTAFAEYAGSGFRDHGEEAIGTGTDAETAIRAALARLPGVGHA